MNRFIVPLIAGAIGGGLTSILAVALLGVNLIQPARQDSKQAAVAQRLDDLENRLEKLELNSGNLSPEDRQRIGLPAQP